MSSIVSESRKFVINDTTSKLAMRHKLLHVNCFKRSMKSSVGFNNKRPECVLLLISRYLANLFLGVPIIDTTSLRSVLSLDALANPISLPGLLQNGSRAS